MKKMWVIITILVFIAASHAPLEAWDTVEQESSTSATDYEYLIDYQVEQDKALKDAKAKISHSVADLSEAIGSLASELEANQLKYAHAKGSATLGDLYGASGKLEVNHLAYGKKPNFLNGLIAVSDSFENAYFKKEIVNLRRLDDNLRDVMRLDKDNKYLKPEQSETPKTQVEPPPPPPPPPPPDEPATGEDTRKKKPYTGDNN